MKLLNSSLLVLALAAGTATFAAAQDQAPTETAAAQQQQAAPRHQPNPKREAKMLAKRLNLTADQTAQIEPILADRMQRVQTLEANTSLDRKTMHQQHKAIMEDTDARLERGADARPATAVCAAEGAAAQAAIAADAACGTAGAPLARRPRVTAWGQTRGRWLPVRVFR